MKTREELEQIAMSAELLALAAKAAGYVVRQSEIVSGFVDHDGEMWNPLEDDGDALRLAVRVGMNCAFLPQVWRESFCTVAADFSDGLPAVNVEELHGDDAHAATRRAIVRAAAWKGWRDGKLGDELAKCNDQAALWVSAKGDTVITCHLPIKTVSEANRRDHWAVKAKRAKSQRHTAAMLVPRLGLPCVVTLVRIGPKALDTDNLSGALKAVRDGVADRLGVQDNDPRVVWKYGQKRGEYGVEITLEAGE